EDYTTEVEGSAETGKVMVVASLLPSAPAASGLPEGVLAKLAFRVGDDADGDIVDLQLSADATAVGENSPLPQDALRTEGSLVYILAPGAMPGCFFFTH